MVSLDLLELLPVHHHPHLVLQLSYLLFSTFDVLLIALAGVPQLLHLSNGRQLNMRPSF